MKIKILLHENATKMLSNGTYPIYLRLTKDRQRRYIRIKTMSALHEQWNSKTDRFIEDEKLNPEFEDDNFLLTEFEQKAKKVLRSFEMDDTDPTLDQFVSQFINQVKNINMAECFNEYISSLRNQDRIGNAITYERTLDMLCKFDARFKKLQFKEIDYKYVKRFDTWLREKRRCNDITITFYMKALRAVMNRKIQEDERLAPTYPFKKYKISKLKKATKKRYLPSVYLDKIKEASYTGGMEESRQIFLFFYYAQGISFMDAARLTDKNIIYQERGRYIQYERMKTVRSEDPKEINILINNNIQGILDYFETCERAGSYLLPIITRNYTGDKLYTHIRNRNKKINTWLKRIAEDLNIEMNLSTYAARHSYAMRLKNQGYSETLISEALGHKDLTTTKTYLDSFQNGEVEKANESL